MWRAKTAIAGPAVQPEPIISYTATSRELGISYLWDEHCSYNIAITSQGFSIFRSDKSGVIRNSGSEYLTIRPIKHCDRDLQRLTSDFLSRSTRFVITNDSSYALPHQALPK